MVEMIEKKLHEDNDSSASDNSPYPQQPSDDDDKFLDCNQEPVQQSIEISMQTKNEAAQLFKDGDLVAAINKYSLALQQSPSSETKHMAILNFNIGMCIIKTTSDESPPAHSTD